MTLQNQFARWGLGASLLLSAGCSREMSDAIVQAARSQSQTSPFGKATDSISEEIESENRTQLAIVAAMPSPNRTNPFELSGEFQEDLVLEGTSRKREIRVIGFIELDNPAVMLSLDGRSQVFKTGETFDKITVLEIKPPRARISYDGVTWNASIFDRRSSQ